MFLTVLTWKIRSIVCFSWKHGTCPPVRSTCTLCGTSHRETCYVPFTNKISNWGNSHNVRNLCLRVWLSFDVHIQKHIAIEKKLKTTDGVVKCYIMPEYCVIHCLGVPVELYGVMVPRTSRQNNLFMLYMPISVILWCTTMWCTAGDICSQWPENWVTLL